MSAAPLGLLFSGQGSQGVGMLDWLFGEFQEAREILARAEDRLGHPLGRLMRRGPESRLRRTAHAQPALLTASTALYRVLGLGDRPSLLAGHSVGEYSALVAAGALEFEDAVGLVAERGRLMQEAVPVGRGGMLAAFAGAEEIAPLVRAAEGDGVLDLAVLNAPSQTVVAGTRDALGRLRRSLRARTIGYATLSVSVPFHSRLLRPMQAPFARALEAVPFRRPRHPVVSNLDGRVLRSHRRLRPRLVRHVCEPVRWERCLRSLVRAGVHTVIEVGPGRALLGHARRVAPELRRLGLSGPEDVQRVRGALALPVPAAPRAGERAGHVA